MRSWTWPLVAMRQKGCELNYGGFSILLRHSLCPRRFTRAIARTIEHDDGMKRAVLLAAQVSGKQQNCVVVFEVHDMLVVVAVDTTGASIHSTGQTLGRGKFRLPSVLGKAAD